MIRSTHQLVYSGLVCFVLSIIVRMESIPLLYRRTEMSMNKERNLLFVVVVAQWKSYGVRGNLRCIVCKSFPFGDLNQWDRPVRSSFLGDSYSK